MGYGRPHSHEIAATAVPNIQMESGDRQFVALADGSQVTVRAIRADDGPKLQAFVRRLSLRSRHFRFFSAIVELSKAQLERLLNLNHGSGLALVALNEQSGESPIVAEARFVFDHEDNSAEFAIAVADEFQRRGLGMRLMKNLVAYASEKRVRRLSGEILVDNHPMLALAARLGFQIRGNPLDHRTMIAGIAPSPCRFPKMPVIP